ncbi:two-component system sensor histidine kinase RegB [Paenochrobactrum gallinarii]|uniref:histidine kinase n=1 Tax=Paenochrobactrum gallinarii TaxID=643673 RepID=A0A841M5W1_9HYPH|nr:ATP-binding protein [Paenochrobactrum gallinarii]MBB6260954.1 two-component system sensor histidine kinase RegB [Paenochrobactrum gallinarii]
MPAQIHNVTNKQHFLFLIQLRWLAVAGQVFTIFFVSQWLVIALPLVPMSIIIGLLVALNSVSYIHYRQEKYISKRYMFVGMLIDVLALSIQFYLSGGASNPFITLFLLQIILAVVLLEAWATWILVVVSSLSFIALTVYYRPIEIPHHDGSDFFNLHIQGMFICFVLASILLVLVVSRIQRNLSERDAQSAEEDHIVRMGLMASGAAHELGTPLATVSVILSDWQRMPILQNDPVLTEELTDMLAQIDRCKGIVSNILLSSGTARGEGAVRTTINKFMDDLVVDWQNLYPATRVDYINHCQPDMPIIGDIALQQVIFNVMDNAREASPDKVGIETSIVSDDLVIAISDEGKGFAPDVLAELGKAYCSTKKRPESGLGLYLVSNVVRKLNGQVSARNQTSGGAIVSIRLPLFSIC